MSYLKKIAYYSEVFITYLFWTYFLFFVFFYKKLSIEFTYLLFLFLGLFLGYKFAMWSIKELKKE